MDISPVNRTEARWNKIIAVELIINAKINVQIIECYLLNRVGICCNRVGIRFVLLQHYKHWKFTESAFRESYQ